MLALLSSGLSPRMLNCVPFCQSKEHRYIVVIRRFLSLYKSCNVPLEDYYRLLRSVTCERCSFAIILEKYPMTEATQCDLLFGAWYNAHIHCVVKSLI